MNKPIKSRGLLFSKSNLAIAIVFSTLALLIAGLLTALYEEQLYRQQKVDELRVQGQILAASVTAALVFGDDKAAQETVTALTANPEIEAAGVYDAKGARFASFARDGAAPAPDTVDIGAPYISENRIVATLPVAQLGMTLGTVYLRSTLDPVARRLIRYAGIGLLVAMAVLVVVGSAIAQRALALANTALENQARELALANMKLEAEMLEREKTEEALRQTQKMEALGRLSGGIAHDFNNLLAIIKGNLQLLQRRISQGRPDVQRHIDAAGEGVTRAANLTQRILAYSRSQPLSVQPVDLSKLLAGMHDLIRHSAGETVQIETRLHSDWLTLCDPTQMENVVLNLAINARDAMPSGGRLVIVTANHSERNVISGVPVGDYVRLEVRDTGIGMSDEVKRKAVEPFFTTKPPGQGTGLGLSMTFGYVQQSKGYLDMQSELGKGTTITILMPRHVESGVAEGAVSNG